MHVCEEIAKMECTDVDYDCFFNIEVCEESCKARTSSEGSAQLRSGCDGYIPLLHHTASKLDARVHVGT